MIHLSDSSKHMEGLMRSTHKLIYASQKNIFITQGPTALLYANFTQRLHWTLYAINYYF